MILQRFVFDTEMPKELYYRGDFTIDNDIFVVGSQSLLSFDTYFNSFHAVKWLKYTLVKSINYAVTIKGKGEITLFSVNSKHKQKRLASITFNEDDYKIISLKDDVLIPDDSRVIYITLFAQSTVWFRNYAYVSNDETLLPKELNIACCFCTYKREKEITRNINTIVQGVSLNPDSQLFNHCEVFVADNGHTLDSESFDSSVVTIFENPNYGGSAGFTRCLIESCIHRNVFSHVILMDDDAIIKPYVIERTAAFISVLKYEYDNFCLGGALVSIYDRTIQYENGVALSKLFTGTYFDHDIDLSDFKNVKDSYENDELITYCGWWYACIPASIINKNNLPLPLFIHWDDKEYGYRTNHSFIRLNGVCVWHPTFSTVSRPYIDYYDSRNLLISMAVNRIPFSTMDALFKLTKESFGRVSYYMYESAIYYLEGCNDYYLGYDDFVKTDPEILNMELIKRRNYKTVELNSNDREMMTSSPEKSHGYQNLMVILNHFIIPFRKLRVYDSKSSFYSLDFFGTKEIHLIDEEKKNCSVIKKDFKLLFAFLKEYSKTAIYLIQNHKRIYRDWIEKSQNLKTYCFWKEYLNR